MTHLSWIIFVGAALLEVGGDAIVRKGLRGGNLFVIAVGCLLLGGYGLVVNSVQWEFSKLLGVYVAVFALVSLVWGRMIFQETISPANWAGLGLITMGGLMIQFGDQLFFD